MRRGTTFGTALRPTEPGSKKPVTARLPVVPRPFTPAMLRQESAGTSAAKSVPPDSPLSAPAAAVAPESPLPAPAAASRSSRANEVILAMRELLKEVSTPAVTTASSEVSSPPETGVNNRPNSLSLRKKTSRFGGSSVIDKGSNGLPKAFFHDGESEEEEASALPAPASALAAPIPALTFGTSLPSTTKEDTKQADVTD